MTQQFEFFPHILDNLIIPSSGFDVVRDKIEPRLQLYITSRGVKTFFVRKRTDGRDKRFIIGNYPKMDIETARGMIDSVLKNASVKPKHWRKKTPFEKIIRIYMDTRVHREELNKLKLWRSINLHLSEILSKNISDISKDDIQNVLDKIPGNVVSNRTLELLISIFKFALDSGYIKNNQTNGILPRDEMRRKIKITDAVVSRLINEIKKEENEILRGAFLMMIYGFARKSRILSMQWRDLDFNNDTWDKFPLSDSAVLVLGDMPQNGKYVFPGRVRGGHLSDPRTSWKNITMRARCKDIRIDDIYKYMWRKLKWSNDVEILRNNMNRVISDMSSNLL